VSRRGHGAGDVVGCHVWDATVHRLPADWFPEETWPVLAAYCSHVVTSRLLTEQIARFEKERD